MALTEEDDFADVDPTTLDSSWVQRLDRVIEQCAEKWDLFVGEELASGYTGYVVSATRSDGTPVVLKLRAPGKAMTREASSLHAFEGKGTVRLLDRDDKNGVLLLERAQPGLRLTDRLREVDVDTEVAKLAGRLVGTQGTSDNGTLAEEAERWASNLERFDRPLPLPAGAVEAAIAQLRDLAASQGDQYLIHADLHVDNVVLSERGWLAVDPRGLVGELEFELGWWLRDPPKLPGADWAADLQRRLDIAIDVLGADRRRVIAWAKAVLPVLVASRVAGMLIWDAERIAACYAAVDALQ